MTINIYTDGSSTRATNKGITENFGGYGVVICMDDTIVKFGNSAIDATSNRMELYALYAALVKVKGYIRREFIPYNKKIDRVVIHSDSSYVVNGVNDGWLQKWKGNNWINAEGDPVKNHDIWKQVDRLIAILTGYTRIELEKVVAHTGNQFNEIADEMAKAYKKEAMENYYYGYNKE